MVISVVNSDDEMTILSAVEVPTTEAGAVTTVQSVTEESTGEGGTGTQATDPGVTDSDATQEPGARFTKYLTTILRLSYDNGKVTIDLRRTSNLQNILRRAQGFSWVRFTCKVARSSETVFAN